MTACMDRALHASSLGWFDLALLDSRCDDELPQSSLNALKALRATDRVRLLGVSGDGEVMDAYVSTGAFDVLVTPLSRQLALAGPLASARCPREGHGRLRHRLFPGEPGHGQEGRNGSCGAKKKGLFGFGGSGGRAKSDPLRGAGTFAFLHRTPNWTAEEICLAYVLTDPVDLQRHDPCRGCRSSEPAGRRSPTATCRPAWPPRSRWRAWPVPSPSRPDPFNTAS